MKRYQELEFTVRSINTDRVLSSIQKKSPYFFEEWGEAIEYLLNSENENHLSDFYIDETNKIKNDFPSYYLGVDKQENLTYVWYIAWDKCQVVA